jgi:hypothetical protein
VGEGDGVSVQVGEVGCGLELDFAMVRGLHDCLLLFDDSMRVQWS